MESQRPSPAVNLQIPRQTSDQDAIHAFSGLGELLSRMVLPQPAPHSDDGHPSYNALLNSLGVAVYTTDSAGRLTFYNEAASELWGWKPPLYDQVWCGSWRIYAPDGSFMPHDRCPMAVCLREARPVRGAWAYAERPDGGRVPFAPFPTPLLNANGVLIGAVNVLVDISGVRTAEEKFTRSEARFRAAQEVSPEGFVVLDAARTAAGDIADFVVSYANPAATRLLRRAGVGLSLSGTSISDLVPRLANGPSGLVSEYAKVVASGEASEQERCLAADDEKAAIGRAGKWYRSRAVPLNDGVAVSFENITVRRRAEARSRFLAEHDELTGLPNRRGFQRALAAALGDRGSIHAGKAALLLLDLDRFKSVNDTLGHPAGDALLRAVAKRLRDTSGGGNMVARLSGDEFAVLMGGSEAGLTNAASLAKEIVATLAEPFVVEGQQVRTGASIGIALAPTDGGTAQELLKNADLSLYRAKTEGRGRWAFFAASMDEEARRRRLLDLDLRRALQVGGEFEIYYQPIVNAGTRSLTGLEALVRWRHPIHGLIGPNEFIPLAEEVGLIVPLGELVLRMACKEAASWPGHLSLAVNVSPAQFHQPRFLDIVKEALDDAGMPPWRLELEITEALLLTDAEAVRDALRTLQDAGIQIALDDFGTGYSSLAYLHNFPFDRVKIDRSFVRDVDNRPRSASILRAVARLATELDMAVTAEGVETEAEFALLLAAGCTEMQGFMFSRPLPVTQIRQMIATISVLPAHSPSEEKSTFAP